MASRRGQQNLRNKAEDSPSVPLMRRLTAARIAYDAAQSKHDQFANAFAAKILKIQQDKPGALFPVIGDEGLQMAREVRNRGFIGRFLVFSPEMKNKLEQEGFVVILHAGP